MHLQSTHIDDSSKQLRDFGLILGSGFIFIFGIARPLLKQQSLPHWPFITGALFFSIALLQPSILRAFYKVWMQFGEVLGNFNTKIILSVVFFIFFVPVSLWFRIIHRDRLLMLKRPMKSTRKSMINRNTQTQMRKLF